MHAYRRGYVKQKTIQVAMKGLTVTCKGTVHCNENPIYVFPEKENYFLYNF